VVIVVLGCIGGVSGLSGILYSIYHIIVYVIRWLWYFIDNLFFSRHFTGTKLTPMTDMLLM